MCGFLIKTDSEQFVEVMRLLQLPFQNEIFLKTGFYFAWLSVVDLQLKYDSIFVEANDNPPKAQYQLMPLSLLRSLCSSQCQEIFFHFCSSNSLLEEFIISTPMMIFGYGPLHAQHDFHSSNLSTGWLPKAWQASSEIAKGRRGKYWWHLRNLLYLLCFIFKSPFQKWLGEEQRFHQAAHGFESIFKPDTSHFFDHL